MQKASIRHLSDKFVQDGFLRDPVRIVDRRNLAEHFAYRRKICSCEFACMQTQLRLKTGQQDIQLIRLKSVLIMIGLPTVWGDIQPLAAAH